MAFSGAPTLLVVSDTHGSRNVLSAVFAWGMKRRVRAIAFLGDGEKDVDEALALSACDVPWLRVRGNGDSDHSIPHADILDLGNKRFFLCHGHLHGVQDGFGPLISAARSLGAQAALYGHTHVPYWEEVDGMLVLNPGSLGRPRSPVGPTFATIECPEDEWFRIVHWSVHPGPLGRYRIQSVGTDSSVSSDSSVPCPDQG
jgi:putative phosphoesterase